MARPKANSANSDKKQMLLLAATEIIRTKGFNSTTVDDLCSKAGVSKGTFFHYFKSKEDLAIAAAKNWSTMTGQFFANAPFHQLSDPLERVLGYVQFRKDILQGSVPEFTCLVGTMVQEIYTSNPEIKDACFESISGHASTLEADIREAKRKYSPKSKWTPKSLALHTQAVLQGAFILAKASGDSMLAMESIDHLENYIRLLFLKEALPRR